MRFDISHSRTGINFFKAEVLVPERVIKDRNDTNEIWISADQLYKCEVQIVADAHCRDAITLSFTVEEGLSLEKLKEEPHRNLLIDSVSFDASGVIDIASGMLDIHGLRFERDGEEVGSWFFEGHSAIDHFQLSF